MYFHNRQYRMFHVTGALIVALVALVPADEQRQEPRASELKQSQEAVEIRGRVVCLAEEMSRLYQAKLPTGHEHLYGFKTNEGAYYTLLRTKFSEALFADKRVRDKELILKGRVFPKSQVFEVSSMRSVRNGVVCDLYYYCVICDIFAVAPGICECCQEPTELVEKPL